MLRANIPTCNILRWTCDLGAVDEPGVNPAVGHVVAGGLRRPRALRAAVDVHARRGRPGVPALRAVLDDWELDGKPVDSILEPMMRRVLDSLRAANAHSSTPIVAGYEVDFLFPGTVVVLECDGWGTHGRESSPVRVRSSSATPSSRLLATSSCTSRTANSPATLKAWRSGSEPTSSAGHRISSQSDHPIWGRCESGPDTDLPQMLAG